MSQGSEALQSIEVDFEEYCRQIEKCRQAANFEPEDWKGAYGALKRLYERYDKKERQLLTNSERHALNKVFYKDNFTKGLMKIRDVAEHVKKRKDFHIYSLTGECWTFDYEMSAREFFCSSDPYVLDINGVSRHIEHLKWLEAWEEAVASAIARAKQ